MAFKPGNPKPPGSGAKKGQKFKKTLERENAHVEQRQELARLCKLHAGKTAEEIMEVMNYDPLVHGIMLALDPTTQPAIQQKIMESLMKKKYPDLKTVENKGEVVNRLEIVLGDGSSAGMFGGFGRPALEETIMPIVEGTVTQVIDGVDASTLPDHISNDGDDDDSIQ